MQKGESIIISAIKNGVMIEPERHNGSIISDKDIIAFKNADDFLKWIRIHFDVYEVPKWDEKIEK